MAGKNPGKKILSSGGKRLFPDVVLGAFKAGNFAVSLLSGLLATALILYSGYVLYDTFATEYNAYSSAQDLLKYKPVLAENAPGETMEVLAAINVDYRAWLTVEDTTLDYPVVQGENDLYYASHDIYRNTSLTGAIYLAAANSPDFSDSYNLVYGHHMDNGAMFGVLDRFTDPEFFRQHRTGSLITDTEAWDLELFAVARTDAYESRIYTVGDQSIEVRSFLTGDRSKDAGVGTQVLIYDEAVGKEARKILAMSTCADAETNGRLVVFARMTLRSSWKPTEAPGTATPTSTPESTPSPTPEAETLTPEPETPTPEAETPTPEPTDDQTATPSPTPTHAGSGTPKHHATPAPGPYKLTIRYEFTDGGTAAPTWTETKVAGEQYSRKNPTVPGYVTARTVVQGTMEARDVEIVVLYIPQDLAKEGETISVEDYEVPLGLTNLHAQMGVTIE